MATTTKKKTVKNPAHAVVTASADIQWQVMRRSSCFLKRQRGVPKLFSVEPFNPKKVNARCCNGLVSGKGVHVKVG